MNSNKISLKTAYIIFVSCLLSILLFFSMYVFRSLELYELSNPDYVMKDILVSLKDYNPYSIELLEDSSNTQSIFKGKESKHERQTVNYTFNIDYSNLIINQFESKDDYNNYILYLLNNGNLTYTKSLNSYSDKLEYKIYSDNLEIFTVKLNGTNLHKRLGLYIYDWEPEMDEMNACKITASNITGLHSFTISAPEDFDIRINGYELNKNSFAPISSEISPSLEETSKHTSIPAIVSYKFSGFFSLPEVSMIHSGNIINPNVHTDYFNDVNDVNSDDINLNDVNSDSISSDGITASDNQDITVSDNMLNYILSQSSITASYESYPVYDSLQALIIEKVTDYEINQKTNSDDDIEIKETKNKKDKNVSNVCLDNFTMENYTVYNNSCFSCEVSFIKHIISQDEEKTESISKLYFFVWDYAWDEYFIVDSQ